MRLADTPSREEKARYALARTALTQYDAMIAAWHPDPQAAPDIIRARIDRLGALYASAEYAQVIREYQMCIRDRPDHRQLRGRHRALQLHRGAQAR